MEMFRKPRSMIATALAFVLIALCAGTAIAEGEELTGTITQWYWDDETPIFEAFNKEYPGITVENVTIGSGDVVKKLQTALAAGTDVPDVVCLEIGVRGKILSMDVLENLEAEPYLFDRETILPWLIPLCTNPNGEVVGIEFGPSPSGIAYRRDIASQYLGIDSPEELYAKCQTWDDLIATAQQIRADSGDTVFGFASVGDVYNCVANFNTDPFIVDGKLVIRDVLHDSLTLTKQIIDAGIVDKLDQWSPAWNASYASKNYLFYPCSQWSPKFVIEPNDPDGTGNWGVMTPPGGAMFNMGGTLKSIPKAAKNKDLAWVFIDWYTGTRAGADVARDYMGYPSPTKEFYEDPAYFSYADPYFAGQDFRKMLSDNIENVNARPLTPYDIEIGDSVNLGLKALADGKSVEEVEDLIVSEILTKVPALSE